MPVSIDELKAVGFFSRLTQEELQSVNEKVHKKTFKDGEILIQEGATDGKLILITKGICSVYQTAPSGKAVHVLSLKTGDYGGLGSIIDKSPHSATVQAKGEVEAIEVDHEDFQYLLKVHPTISRNIMRFLSSQIKFERNLLAEHRDDSGNETIDVIFYDAKPYDKVAFDKFSKETGYKITYVPSLLTLETVRLAAGFKYVCLFVNDHANAEIIYRLKELGVEAIFMRCAGFDKVDLDACAACNISVSRVPAYSPYAVAEHAAALMMCLNRKLATAYNRVRNGNFELNGLVGFDMYGKTVGVVGTGKIGQCFIDIAIGFGCTILCYDVFKAPVVENNPKCTYVELDELFRRSDVISLHCPLFPSTKHTVNAERLAIAKKGVVIINSSRGPLIDTKALINGLKSGKVGGAGLDVLENEAEYFFKDKSGEVIQDDVIARILTFNNVIVTSHQAFLTQEALNAIATVTSNNIKEYLSGKRMTELTNSVNKK